MRGSSPKFRTGGVICYPEPEEIIKLERIATQKITTSRKLLEQIISDYIKDYESKNGEIIINWNPPK